MKLTSLRGALALAFSFAASVAVGADASSPVFKRVTVNVATGTPPFVISSTSKVVNLYADRAALADVASAAANNSITNAMLAQMAQGFSGRATSGTGNREDLTPTQATALLNPCVGDSGSGGTKGLVPAPGAGDAVAGKVLGAGCTWVTAAAAESLPWFTPEQFSAVGDGVANDTTPLQNAINAAVAVKGRVHCTNGKTYKITAPLTASGPFVFSGDSFESCTVAPATTINAFEVTTTLSVKFENFQIVYSSLANTGTTAIKIDASAGNTNNSSIIKNVQILRANYCVQHERSAYFITDGLYCLLFRTVGEFLENTTNPDAGDSTTVNSLFLANDATATACTQWVSSGGYRFVNNKCLTAANGLIVQLASGAVTAQLIANDNSFDGMTGSALSLVRSGATGTFARVVFNGNICNGVLVCIQVPNDANGAWIKNLVATGNSYIGINSASAIFAHMTQVQGFVIANNVLESQNAGTYAYAGDVTATNCFIGPNVKIGTFTASANGGGCSTTSPF